ncbi:MAG: LemA family protein [Burkholderiales bacterium]|nr:LemA family protein [Burkholderiales bacterium]
MKRFLLLVCTLLTFLSLSGCGYNEVQSLDEDVNAKWSEVLNQYQRRNDLIPNIVASVKGEADFEKSTLSQVIEARAKATSVQASPELLNNPEQFQKFTQAQGQLTSALSRLLVSVERYPTLQANKGFQDLRIQLEGCENRITIARNNYITTVQAYNTYIRQFPQMIWTKIFGYKPKPQYTVADVKEAETPPKVEFGASLAE